MIIRELPELDAAINEESWLWLQDCLPGLATALINEVLRGAGADEVRRFVLRRTQRPALAMRCCQAASFLINNQNLN